MNSFFHNQLTTFFFIVGSLSLASGVKINNLQVPGAIRHGEPVLLDCDFTLEPQDEDLVVKWFFNKNNQTLVYQWIPASKSRPQVLGILKDRLNLEYAASIDANSVHRALHIIKAAPDLSGEYTCKVSTMQSEDVRMKKMLVFVPAKELLLRRVRADKGLIRVQCIADEVFPKPVMKLSSKRRTITSEDTAKEKGNLFEVIVTTELVALDGPEEFSCEIRIPQANYTECRETVIYPGGNNSNLTVSHCWVTLSTYLVTLFVNLNRIFIGST